MTRSTVASRRRFLRSAVAVAAAGPAAAQDAPRVPRAPDALRDAVANAPLALRFRGATAADATAWQVAFGTKLFQLLGPHDPPAKWATHRRGTAEFDDHTREDLVLAADGVPPLPVYLLLPRGKDRPRRVPGVVALHGHGAHGHHPVAGRDDLPGVAKAIASARYDYGRQFARRGYAVAVPCLTPFGDRGAEGGRDTCGDTFIRLQMLGRLLIAENLRDCRWALSLLAARPEVNPDRLGCVGLSYGGRMTTLTAATDSRVKAAVISGALNVMQERVGQPYGCGAQIIPGLLQFGDVPEIGGLIAPRPCLWEAGTRDALIKPAEADDALARMRAVYSALGAADRLQVDRFDGGHVWHGEKAYPLLDAALK